MSKRRPFSILPQPDGTTCGPTCLHAVYQHYGDKLSLDRVIRDEVPFYYEDPAQMMMEPIETIEPTLE